MADRRFTPLPGYSHQTVTLGAGVLTLNDPIPADGILVQATGQNIRFTLDGTTPSASVGFQLVAGDPPLYIELNRFIVLRFFREASGAVLSYVYSGLSL